MGQANGALTACRKCVASVLVLVFCWQARSPLSPCSPVTSCEIPPPPPPPPPPQPPTARLPNTRQIQLRAHLRSCLDRLAGAGKGAEAELLKKRAEKRFAKASKAAGEDAKKDRNVAPLVIPTVIALTKYDAFQSSVESEARKRLLASLRYIAHCHGSSLMCCSCNKDGGRMERTFAQLRGLLNHHAFSLTLKVNMEQDSSKAVAVVSGHDSFASIGSPMGVEKDTFWALDQDGRLDKWRDAVEAAGIALKPKEAEGGDLGVGAETEQKSSQGEGSSGAASTFAGTLAPEPVVDAARFDCEQALESYRWEYERRARLRKQHQQGEKLARKQEQQKDADRRRKKQRGGEGKRGGL